MAITTSQLTGAITVGLVGSGLLGPLTPKLAAGIATGLMLWLPQVAVITVDSGSMGAGVGQVPFAVPQDLLKSNLLAAYTMNGHLGPMAPCEAAGLANGLAAGFAQGYIRTVHSAVSVGTAIARLTAPPAFPSLVQGFASAGITGQGASLKANAISTALVGVLSVFTASIPIAGVPGLSSGAGSGSGIVV